MPAGNGDAGPDRPPRTVRFLMQPGEQILRATAPVFPPPFPPRGGGKPAYPERAEKAGSPMAREMYLVGVSEEELRPDPKPEGPKTPKDKLSNFWYHYKWVVIGGVIAAVFLTIVIGQILTRDDPDYLVVLATEEMVADGWADLLGEEMAAYGRDLDGDGKVEVAVEALYTGGRDQVAMANQTKLMAHLSAGDVMFYIFDKATYESTIVPQQTDGYYFYQELEVEVPGLSEDGRYWNWKDDPVRSEEGLNLLPEDLYFGVRTVGGTASDKQSVQMSEECLELLQNFLTKTVPEPAPSVG